VKEHELVGEGCGCNPAIGIEDGRVVVEHKSWG
jgi:hypothetical protein